jgi:elongator complex protein 3
MPLSTDEAIREIIEALMLLDQPSHRDVITSKFEVASRHHLEKIPSNADIINSLTPSERLKLLKALRRKATRIVSGVSVIAVMTKPQPCPQPEPCAYCPGGPSLGVPQSYTGFEPAALRGTQNNYDPFSQVKSRIRQLAAIGHTIDKVELIVMGGTFPSTPMEYQEWFIKRCLDALNETESSDLEEAKRIAEKSKIRNAGITVETRPDWATKKQVDEMLNMGVTRVELGVQNPNDQIYALVGRTHTVADVENATCVSKDAGLKVVYHLMPGMPGSTPDKDLEVFKSIFTDERFKPDMIKIYPCLVIDHTKVHQWYQEGKYVPYTTDQAVDLIAKLKKELPPWVRVMRVQRDIPAKLIVAGVKRSNLRELVQEKLTNENAKCQCIRCREVGHQKISEAGLDPEKIKIIKDTYAASKGTEVFISAEDSERKILVGYLRLRIPSNETYRPEIISMPSAIVRELHVYGIMVPVSKHHDNAWQHKGYGKVLLNEAERIAREDYDLKKILIISALGTKQYYMRLGYKHDGVYVSKNLEN